jgi:hypothetical protein
MATEESSARRLVARLLRREVVGKLAAGTSMWETVTSRRRLLMVPSHSSYEIRLIRRNGAHYLRIFRRPPTNALVSASRSRRSPSRGSTRRTPRRRQCDRRQSHIMPRTRALRRKARVRILIASRSSQPALSPRRERPSRRRPTIAIDGERRATPPRRGDRNATNAIVRSAARLTIAWATKHSPASSRRGPLPPRGSTSEGHGPGRPKAQAGRARRARGNHDRAGADRGDLTTAPRS